MNWDAMWWEWRLSKIARGDIKGWKTHKAILAEWRLHILDVMKAAGVIVIEDERPV